MFSSAILAFRLFLAVVNTSNAKEINAIPRPIIVAKKESRDYKGYKNFNPIVLSK
jgi:hypothetical protein